MKKIIGVLILFLAGSLFIGCGSGASAANEILEAASIGIVGGCEIAKEGPALAISIFDSSTNLPVTGAKIRYQVNGGKWKEDLELTTTNPTPIKGSSGQYNIEIRKSGFPLQTAVVFVPQDESCSVLQQSLMINLRSPVNCPSPSSEFVLKIVQPIIIEGLNVNVEYPTGTLAELPCNGGECRVPTQQIGNYKVDFIGFPDQRMMLLEGNLVRYDYQDIEIEMIVGQRVHKLRTEGVDNIDLLVPYEFGDNGCLGVVFDRVVANRQHFQTTATNMVETRERQSLRLADLNSEICKRQSTSFIVEYDVILPAGTALSEVKVDYWLADEWHSASCSYRLNEKSYVCQAEYQNPVVGDTYNIRTTIGEKEFFGSYISLNNKCIYFE